MPVPRDNCGNFDTCVLSLLPPDAATILWHSREFDRNNDHKMSISRKAVALVTVARRESYEVEVQATCIFRSANTSIFKIIDTFDGNFGLGKYRYIPVLIGKDVDGGVGLRMPIAGCVREVTTFTNKILIVTDKISVLTNKMSTKAVVNSKILNVTSIPLSVFRRLEYW